MRSLSPVCHPEPFDKAQAKASGRRICAQADEATPQPDPSVHHALRPFDCAQGKLAEWGRMTNMGKPSVPIMPGIVSRTSRHTRHARRFQSGIHPDSCLPMFTPDASPVRSSSIGFPPTTRGDDDREMVNSSEFIRYCLFHEVQVFTLYETAIVPIPS
jgi:hypothetical protein